MFLNGRRRGLRGARTLYVDGLEAGALERVRRRERVRCVLTAWKPELRGARGRRADGWKPELRGARGRCVDGLEAGAP